jgi:histidine kinase
MLESSQSELARLLGRNLFEEVPFNAAVIDRDFRIVAANGNFEDFFGDWRNRKCYEVYKHSNERCRHCQAAATFADGQVRVSDETGVDQRGRKCHYVVHLAPLRGDDGTVNFVIEMTTDLTETRHWRREYDLFFERVPCYVLVIDRDFRIVRANEKFRQAFGETDGKYCYEACKRRESPCLSCPAALTFRDGGEHTSHQEGVHQDGTPAYYVVTSSPLTRGDNGVVHVIEMATDVTQIRQLEDELQSVQHFYESLIHNSPAGIIAVDTRGNAKIMNPAARDLLAWKKAEPPSAATLSRMLPREFFDSDLPPGIPFELEESVLCPVESSEVPVRFSAVSLALNDELLGRAAFVEDLRHIKRLEQEKLEAERLAAVGQTVAGLAHTIKNLLMGLEGGMYMVDSGLRRSNVDRITKGWGILQRNFEKTTALVKGFLDFAKGRLPQPRNIHPNALVHDLLELYAEAARRQGVALIAEAGEDVREAPLDPAGIETCLTNLLSNAVDAAALRTEPGGRVVLRTREEGADLVFEVEDNGCGMDSEVKAKVFTTFFTTKGGSGTGLGLLTTRKIVQEHGGRIEVESNPGQGATFRIRLPRKRLQAIAEAVHPESQREMS